jgi:replicative DNA helicase
VRGSAGHQHNGDGHQEGAQAEARVRQEQPRGGDGAAEGKPRFRFRTSAEFLRGDYRLAWLVNGLLVQGQPAVLGGPKKSLKTCLLVDLAYSLATASPFLGRFAVPRRWRVGVMSGESGEATLKETALRIGKAKGIDPEAADVLWEFNLPRLADPVDLGRLQDAIRGAGLDVLIIDPLYLCVLNGIAAANLQSSNVYQMGPLFLAVARACLDVGCTPILAHHFKLSRANPHDEPQLEDLAFAGVQEFCRQWALIGRRERYSPGSGLHRLWLSVGGSAGQSGLWSVDIDEGVIDQNFGGRRWDVSVSTATEARETGKAQERAAKREQEVQQDNEDDDALLAALKTLDPGGHGAGYNRVQAEARLSDARMVRAVRRLEDAEVVQDVKVMVTVGHGAEREVRGLRRVREEG